jgi:hypothetical protein
LNQAPQPPNNEPEGIPRNTRLALAVLRAAAVPAKPAVRTKMKGLIGMVGKKAESLKKPLLQIIGRSGWTSEKNPSVVDKMVSFFAKLSTPVDVAKLGRVVFSIDALLVRTEIDLKSLGDDIGDILTLEDEIVVLDRAIFVASSDEPTKAQRFDALVKSYYVANKFETGYLGHLTRLCNGIRKITDDDKTGIMEIVVKILDAPESDKPRLDIHLALATIEYFAKFGRLPKSEWYSGGNRQVSDMLEKLAQVPIASYKSIFFELIGICAWDAESQAYCLERMADFLNFPPWLFFEPDRNSGVLAGLIDEFDNFTNRRTQPVLYEVSSLCHWKDDQWMEGTAEKLDCVNQISAIVVESARQLRAEIDARFNQEYQRVGKDLSVIIPQEITSAQTRLKNSLDSKLVELGLKLIQKP